jgi:hypothetical protein
MTHKNVTGLICRKGKIYTPTPPICTRAKSTQQGLMKVGNTTSDGKVHKLKPIQGFNIHIPYSITSDLLRKKDTVPALSVCLQAGVKSAMMMNS